VSAKKKGRTRWRLLIRDGYPIRPGMYECGIRLSRSLPVMAWDLEYDGIGFLVPVPMMVLQWRGLTKKAHDAALAAANSSPKEVNQS
jgi:hypothetical protein